MTSHLEPRTRIGRRTRVALLGLALAAALLSGCADGDDDPDPTPSATAQPDAGVPSPPSGTPSAGTPSAGTPPASADPGARPTPPSGGAAGEIVVDLAPLAATGESELLDVQACLGGQCRDEQLDPSDNAVLGLDTAGLQAGDATIVTVTVTRTDGTIVAQHEETVTLGAGATTVAVQPDG